LTDIAPEPTPTPSAGPRRTGGIWLGALLVFAGGAWLLSALGILDLGLETGIALALIGIGTVVALDAGHSHGGLVVLAVVLSLAGAATTWVDADLFDGGVGDRSAAPATAAEAAGGYDLGMGKLALDLTALTDPGAVVRVRAEVGIGQLYVTVPPDAEVRLDAHVSMGNINTVGIDHGGFDVSDRSILPGTGQAIALEADVGIGEVRITRAP
jgi:hypothetical protein